MDLRRRVVESYLAGEGTYDEVARRFAVGRASVDRWVNLCRASGSYAPRPHGGGARAKVDAEGLTSLAKLVAERPDITLAELAKEYADRREIRVALSILCRALKKLGLGRKKDSPCV